MASVREGGCQCGAVRYRIEGAPLDLYVCHCSECQRQSGSAFGMSLIVPVAAFRLLAGELRSFTVRCASGRSKRCSFCPECGTRLHHGAAERGFLSVKAGTLDERSGLVPRAHLWTRSKQPWTPIPEGVPSHPTEPE